jgi:SAM-dependent methyltransferase
MASDELRCGRPLLSMCAMTSAPPARARAFLECWRPLVDEVVVAVDERAHPETTAACAGLADRVYVVPAALQHMERYLGWLHSTCSGRWILRADDDELPGDALRGALPALLEEPEPTHYWLPRAWLHPTVATRLDGGIWQRDIQVRIVRNLPGLWRFTGRLHSNIEVMGASRVLDAPLLHLALLVSGHEERRAKVERYERVQPGLVHESGVPLNSVFLPEDMGDIASAPTSPADAATATAYLESSAGPPPPSAAVRAARVAAEEIERWNTERLVPAGAYRARVRLPHGVASMRAESLQHVQVEVTNLGDAWWPRGPEPEPPIQVGHRWWDEDGDEIVMATVRTPFTETVAPGATTRLTMAIQAPSVTGRLGLRVDVVHEAVRWFECEERHTVEVTPPYDEGFFAAKDTGARESARAIMPRLLELSSAQSVIDVGCGTGTWLSVARELGIDDVLGLDGDWVRPEALEIPADRFRAVDLAAAPVLDRRFDLALSLEVAEHLSPTAADRFVGLLVGTAPLVAFSAAIPGQGGHGHVNEQWPGFWAERFSAHGYEVVDCLREPLWEDERVEWWYRQNLLLFGAPDALDAVAGLREHRRRGVPPLPLVHPDLFGVREAVKRR